MSETWLRGQKLLDRNTKILIERYGAVNISRAQKFGEWVSDVELTFLARTARNAKCVIECGSWHGKSARAIADNLPADGVLYCIDTWLGSKVEQDNNHASAREMDGDHAYDTFCRNLWDHIATGKVKPLRMHGKHGAKLLLDMGVKAELVFVDADHTLEGVRDDIRTFAPLAKDGILAGHDYAQPMWPGVKRAVDEIFQDVHLEDSIWSVKSPEVKPRVFDCFSFFNELELLEVRLNELDSVVDRFVICEASLTHTGKPKPLYFKENIDKFAKWMHKISHIVVDFPPGLQPVPNVPGYPSGDAWAYERYQRDTLMRALDVEARDGDICIISDADEIPSAFAVREYRTEMGICLFEMDFYCYRLNCKSVLKWREAKILPFELLRQISCCGARYSPASIGTYGTPLLKGGWHFSYLGGVERVLTKLQSFAHTERATPEVMAKSNIVRAIARGEDLYGRPEERFNFVKIDGSFPKFIVDNQEKFLATGWIRNENN